MLIGEIAKKTNLSRHTIRFYEKMGLIEVPDQSRRDNNYKEYSEETLRLISTIQYIKSQGFTLREAKAIIYLIKSGQMDPERGKKYITRKVRTIEHQINQLIQTKSNLMRMFENSATEDCEISRMLSGKCDKVS